MKRNAMCCGLHVGSDDARRTRCTRRERLPISSSRSSRYSVAARPVMYVLAMPGRRRGIEGFLQGYISMDTKRALVFERLQEYYLEGIQRKGEGMMRALDRVVEYMITGYMLDIHY